MTDTSGRTFRSHSVRGVESDNLLRRQMLPLRSANAPQRSLVRIASRHSLDKKWLAKVVRIPWSCGECDQERTAIDGVGTFQGIVTCNKTT